MNGKKPCWSIAPVLLFISSAGFGSGFSISGGTVTVADSAHLNTISDLVINTGLLTANNSQIVVGGNWANSGGSFTPGTSTVTLNATTTGKTITSHGSAFYNLYFNGSGGYWTLQDSMTVLSTMTLSAGTLDTNSGGSYAMSVGGGWLNNGGTFTVNGSTVTFTGSAAQVINNAGQSFAVLVDSNTSSGGVVFASSFTATGLAINSAGLASPTTAYFNAGSTYTITNLTLVGGNGKMVWIRSTTNGQAWFLKNVSTNTVAYVDVEDSNANAGTTIAAGPNSIDSGRNFNWTFMILGITFSTHSYDFGMVNLGATTVSTSPVTITNAGNVTETYSLAVATTGAKTIWGVGTSTPTAFNTFVMFGAFNAVQPSSTTFGMGDIITSTSTASSATIFSAGGETGLSVPAGTDRHLWLRLDMPLTTGTTNQQMMNLTVTAATP